MDCGCADAVAELEYLALDALVAPGLVLSGHPFDQRGDGLVEGWATERFGWVQSWSAGGGASAGLLPGDQAVAAAPLVTVGSAQRTWLGRPS